MSVWHITCIAIHPTYIPAKYCLCGTSPSQSSHRENIKTNKHTNTHIFILLLWVIMIRHFRKRSLMNSWDFAKLSHYHNIIDEIVEKWQITLRVISVKFMRPLNHKVIALFWHWIKFVLPNWASRLQLNIRIWFGCIIVMWKPYNCLCFGISFLSLITLFDFSFVLVS